MKSQIRRLQFVWLIYKTHYSILIGISHPGIEIRKNYMHPQMTDTIFVFPRNRFPCMYLINIFDFGLNIFEFGFFSMLFNLVCWASLAEWSKYSKYMSTLWKDFESHTLQVLSTSIEKYCVYSCRRLMVHSMHPGFLHWNWPLWNNTKVLKGC